MRPGGRQFDHDSMIRSATSTLILALAVSTVPIGAAPAFAVAADPTPPPVAEPEWDLTMDRLALDALVSGDDTAALAVSGSFVGRFGYAPEWRDAMAVAPAGACSSPIPLPDAFRSPCAAHDFGYDLLRAVEPASSRERRGLDARLIDRLDGQCAESSPPTGRHWSCRILVEVISRGLRVNTWRQEGDPPLEESVSDILLSLVRKVVAP